MNNAEIFGAICTIIVQLNIKGFEFGPIVTFASDLDLDSLSVMDLVADIVDEFDILLPLNRLPDLETIQQVTDAVESIVKKGE